jgi:hypothetical protein
MPENSVKLNSSELYMYEERKRREQLRAQCVAFSSTSVLLCQFRVI